MKTLSSDLTFAAKFLLPAAWIGLFGLFTLGTWTGLIEDRYTSRLGAVAQWMYLIGWIGGSIWVLWITRRLMKVEHDATHLHISNFRRSVSVPLSGIVDVTQNLWTKHRPITIHLSQPTAFGQQILFLPRSDGQASIFRSRQEDPVVAELRQLAAQQRAAASFFLNP